MVRYKARCGAWCFSSLCRRWFRDRRNELIWWKPGTLEAGADVIGASCGNSIDEMIEITKSMRSAAPIAPILIPVNSGRPAFQDGKPVCRETPEYMTLRIPALLSAGAVIVGGCCGTTPAHIAAIAKAACSPKAAADMGQLMGRYKRRPATDERAITMLLCICKPKLAPELGMMSLS